VAPWASKVAATAADPVLKKFRRDKDFSNSWYSFAFIVSPRFYDLLICQQLSEREGPYYMK
jgi:hypothetical protein